MGKRELFLKEKNSHPIWGEVACFFPLGANWRKMCVCVGGALGAEVSRVISVWGVSAQLLCLRPSSLPAHQPLSDIGAGGGHQVEEEGGETKRGRESRERR